MKLLESLPFVKKFLGKGSQPWEYYSPSSESSNLVDKGVDTGLPFEGKSIDIGAVEFGAKLPVWDVPEKPE